MTADQVNTSSTGGYLRPSPTPAPLEGAELENFFQSVIVGVTGLDSTLVRPRWQPSPPAIPDKGTVWIAFGFHDESADTYVWLGELSDGSATQLQNQEQFAVLCSVYGTGAGSDAKKVAKILRDGLQIPQNREPMFQNGMGLVEVTAPVPVPVLVKQDWLYRLDMSIRVRRAVVRQYQILTIESAQVELVIDAQTNEIDRTINVEDTNS